MRACVRARVCVPACVYAKNYAYTCMCVHVCGVCVHVRACGVCACVRVCMHAYVRVCVVCICVWEKVF